MRLIVQQATKTSVTDCAVRTIGPVCHKKLRPRKIYIFNADDGPEHFLLGVYATNNKSFYGQVALSWLPSIVESLKISCSVRMHSGANQLKIACRPTLMFCKACPNGGAEVQVYPRKRGHGGYGGRASENGLESGPINLFD